MKMLFFGAGVVGSFYAAKLHAAGHDVTILARGTRYEQVREHGIVLEDFSTGERSTAPVQVVDEMPTDEPFDVCVVAVQKTQLESALTALGTNPHIRSYLSLVNAAEDSGDLINAVGRDRVVLGHANVGGERDDHVTLYMTAQEMTIGELSGEKTERLQRIASIFRDAGLPCFSARTWNHGRNSTWPLSSPSVVRCT